MLNFYKLPPEKIIYASIRSYTLRIVNQRFLIFYIYIYETGKEKAKLAEKYI